MRRARISIDSLNTPQTLKKQKAQNKFKITSTLTHLVWEFSDTRASKLLNHPAQVGRIITCRAAHGDDDASLLLATSESKLNPLNGHFCAPLDG